MGMGRDSSVGIATRYGMDGPLIESWWERDFPHPGAHPASYTMGKKAIPLQTCTGPEGSRRVNLLDFKTMAY
jgi:hypothetical protein